MIPIDPAVLLAAVVNSLLAAVGVGAITLVGRDARRRGLSWAGTLGWVLVALFLFPLGLGLYLLARHQTGHAGPNREPERQAHL